MKSTRFASLSRVLILFGLVLTVCLMGAASKKNDKGARIRAKAQYYYLEGVRHAAADSLHLSHEYFKKAWLTDPSYSEAASAFGLSNLVNPNNDIKSEKNYTFSLNLLRQYVDSFPDDFYEANFYAYTAAQLDSVSDGIRVLNRTYNIYPDRTAILMSLAMLYKINNMPDSALEAYRRYEAIEGRNVQVTINKASMLLTMNDTIGALAELDSLIADFPQESSYIALKGKVYDVVQMPDSALSYFLKAERMNPDDGSNKMALAEYFLAHGDSVAYDNKIYEALLAEDFDVEEKTQIMAEYLQQLLNDKHDTSRGDYLFTVLQRQYQYEPEVLSLAARYAAAKGNYDEAIENIGYAIDLDPDDAEKPSMKMSYQLSAEKYKDAMQTYRDYYTSRHLPSNSAKLLFASAATQAADYQASDSILTHMFAEIVPDISPLDSITDRNILRSMSYDNLLEASALLTMIGDNHYNAKDNATAFVCYANALFFFRENSSALNNFAYYLVETGGDLDKAEQMSSQAIELNPDNSTFLDTYAWILFKKGDLENALSYMQAAIEKSVEENNNSSDFYEHLAEIQEALGNSKEAHQAWLKAYELAPDNEHLRSKAKIKKSQKRKK